MQQIDIDLEKLVSYPAIKPGIIHWNGTDIYKHSPLSQPVLKHIENNLDNVVFKNLSTQKAYLYYQKKYFGYMMEFNNKISLIKDAIYKGVIIDLNKFLLELLNIIEKLNSLNLCYWDFHQKNIYANNDGKPFIIDVDDMIYNPNNEDLHDQRKYLSEFIIYLYFKKDLSTIKFARNEVIEHFFNKKTLDYLEDIGNISIPAPDLPYILLEEFHDEEKIRWIKRRIK